MTNNFTTNQLSPEEQKELADALEVVQRLGAYTVMEKDRVTKEWRVVPNCGTVKGREAARRELERYRKTFGRHPPKLQAVPKNLADAIRYNFRVVKRQLGIDDDRNERDETYRLPSGMVLPDRI